MAKEKTYLCKDGTDVVKVYKILKYAKAFAEKTGTVVYDNDGNLVFKLDEKTVDGVTDAVNNTAKEVKKEINDTKKDIDKTVDKAKDIAKDTVKDISDAVSETVDKTKDLADGTVKCTTKHTNKVCKILKSFLNKIKSIFTGK